MRTHTYYQTHDIIKLMKADASRKILGYLVLAGAVSVAATSPFFLYKLAKLVVKDLEYKSKYGKKLDNAFYYLKKKGYIIVEKDGHDITVAPTQKGAKMMKRYQILELKVEEPKKWDGKIRVVAFDIPDTQRIKRNAFRRKLKELGFYSSQKSVWLHPFNCRKQIQILKDFFGFDDKQIHFFTAERIEDERLLKRIKDVYKI